MEPKWFAAVLSGAALVAGCRAGPDAGSAIPASSIETREVAGLGFAHQLLVAGAVRADDPQYVFLEGDGRPWSPDGRHPATDPDPVRAIAPELAAVQGGGALVLGRPCYHGRAEDPGCGPALWTDGRYSEPVVASMVAALDRVLETPRSRPVVLVGYSGGGALALLIANRVPAVRAVVTLASNLDVDAWASLHGYQPLARSLDPLVTRSVRPGCEIHIAAERDTVVPPSLIRSAAEQRPGALVWIEGGADHACCWASRWLAIAARVSAQLESAGCLASG